MRFLIRFLYLMIILALAGCSGGGGGGSEGKSYPLLAGYNIGAPHNYHEAAFQRELAKRDLIVLGLYSGWDNGGKTAAQVVQEIKALNPEIIIGAYTDMTKVSDFEPLDAAYRDKLYAESGPSGLRNWWSYDSAGNRTDWTTDTPGGEWHDTNLTSFVTPDSNGDTWPTWLAKKHHELVFTGNGFDFWFTDNNFWKPRSLADWNLDGTDDSWLELTVQGWWRAGQRAYYDKAKETAPSLYLIANVDNDLSGDFHPKEAEPFNEYKNVLHGAMIENIMGVSWSVETWGTWDRMRQWYYSVYDNLLEPKIVIFQVYGPTTDYQFFRYAFTSCLMNNGYFIYSDTLSFESYTSLPWFDEYDLAGAATTKWLGKAIDPPPVTTWQNGVYRRIFANGMVIVNPKGNGQQTVTVESGYKRIAGTQDPSVNNGQTVTTITLNERDGIIIVKQ
jgi:hypothetical protein